MKRDDVDDDKDHGGIDMKGKKMMMEWWAIWLLKVKSKGWNGTWLLVPCLCWNVAKAIDWSLVKKVAVSATKVKQGEWKRLKDDACWTMICKLPDLTLKKSDEYTTRRNRGRRSLSNNKWPEATSLTSQTDWQERVKKGKFVASHTARHILSRRTRGWKRENIHPSISFLSTIAYHFDWRSHLCH